MLTIHTLYILYILSYTYYTYCNYTIHTILYRYADTAKMAVSAAQLAESVRVLQQVGVVPADYAAPALWSTPTGSANPVVALA